MTKVTKPRAFLLYWFRIQPSKVDAFQTWARDHGMRFWEQHAGIVRYRTFRQQSASQLQEYLVNATQAGIHGVSQVEAEDVEALRCVLLTEEFQAIQREFLRFIEPGSLKHSVLECAYDSWIMSAEAVQEGMINHLEALRCS